MEKGTRVIAEMLVNGMPSKITGTVMRQYKDGVDMYEIQPDGFQKIVLNVQAVYVYGENWSELRNQIEKLEPIDEQPIIQPKLDYKKKRK